MYDRSKLLQKLWTKTEVIHMNTYQKFEASTWSAIRKSSMTIILF